MSSPFKKSFSYFFQRYILRRKFLVAKEHTYQSVFKFKTEDVIGRHIFKRGQYETHITDFIASHIAFESDDIALDIGANIGWYSILFSKLMPAEAKIIAFEPDPLNYELLTQNIELNHAKNIKAHRIALSDKKEVKKLYLYSNKNLGRHSLLDINDDSQFVEVETRVLDDELQSMGINFENIKIAKIDIEGYEYFALLGAERVLKNVRCVVSEFVPAHMKKGGVEPSSLIDMMKQHGFRPNEIRDGVLVSLDFNALHDIESADLIWLRE
jgi:FkbM family methyltransferase